MRVSKGMRFGYIGLALSSFASYSAAQLGTTLSDSCYLTTTVIYGNISSSASASASYASPSSRSPGIYSSSLSSTTSFEVSTPATSLAVSSTRGNGFTTTGLPTPTSSPFIVTVRASGSRLRRRATEYLTFADGEAYLTLDQDEAAICRLTSDGLLMDDGGNVGTSTFTNVQPLLQNVAVEPDEQRWSFQGGTLIFGDSTFYALPTGKIVVAFGDSMPPTEAVRVSMAMDFLTGPTSTSFMSTESGQSTEPTTSTPPPSTMTTTSTSVKSTDVMSTMQESTTAGSPNTIVATSSLDISISMQGTTSSFSPPSTLGHTITTQLPQTSLAMSNSVMSVSSSTRSTTTSRTVQNSMPPSPTYSTSAHSTSSTAFVGPSISTASMMSSSNVGSPSASFASILSSPVKPSFSSHISSTSPSSSSSLSSTPSTQPLSSSNSPGPTSGTSTSTTAATTTTTTTARASTTSTRSSTTSTSTSTSTSSRTSSTSSASSSPTSYPSSKRGLAYTNVTTLTYYPPPSPYISWSYDYYSLPNASDNIGPYPSSQYRFIPLLYNDAASLTSIWPANVNYSISHYGSDAIFGFNEPDACYSGQSACMNLSLVLAGYQNYMQPFAGRVRIGAPAVTNSGAPGGLTYLGYFLGNATATGPVGKNLTVDFINLHWYSSPYAIQYFMDYITEAYQQTGGGRWPVWVTEFGMDRPDYDQATVVQFMKNATRWMDQQSWIERYAWFGNFNSDSGKTDMLLNADGSGRGPLGNVWYSYNGTA
ncbi:hypothetical protein PV05_00703 [Exophiala xenobiotica]|uniref:Uncharacterized protein n=1 Tax=Exophiala xenobiotica TaxID=348802 RepID=A0A0D2FK38_9EURO|nr:uncharacterized protein PV05_00703 [Exophiala xenobiotica]KIW60489.1 hypothetical protein PV05_00703 [Exophiala xenobiotica]